MTEHQPTIDLIEKEIENQVNLRDYYLRIAEKWPDVGRGIAACDQTIASLRHTREVLRS